MIYRNMEKLSGKLPKNYAKTIRDTLIAKKNMEFSLSYIEKVVLGVRNNLDILEVAVELAEQQKQNLNSLKQRVHKL